MTTPKVGTISRGGSRFYVEPTTGEKVPGVTSVLGGIPKPFLQYWGQKVVAEFVADNVGSVTQLLLNGQRQAAIDMMKNAPRRYTTERANIGTEAHDLFERMARGEDIGKVHPDFQGYVEQFEKFLADFQPEYLMMEETVWSNSVGYAGSFDAIATVGGETVVIDYKTTKSVYPEVGLQLSAYRYADHVVRPDGNTVPLPKMSGGAVLHIHPDNYEFIPLRCDEEVFDTFKVLRKQFEWKELSKTVVGKPLAPIFH